MIKFRNLIDHKKTLIFFCLDYEFRTNSVYMLPLIHKKNNYILIFYLVKINLLVAIKIKQEDK